MNKKDLKFYEAPAMEVVEVELQGVLCSSPGDGSTDGGVTTPDWD